MAHGPEVKKVKDRMAVKKQHMDRGPEQKGETRDIVSKASGFGSIFIQKKEVQQMEKYDDVLAFQIFPRGIKMMIRINT